jgi:hypothetical protein
MKYLYLIALSSLLLIPTVSFAQDANDTVIYTAKYAGKFSGFSVDMEKQLIAKGNNRYHMKSRAKSFLGSINEDSHFLTFDGRMVPLSYRDKRKIIGKSSDRRLTFDWKHALVHFERKEKPQKNRDNAITEGVLDPALYPLKLQQEVYANIENPSFTFAKDQKIKTMSFQKKEDLRFTLKGTTYDAVRYERAHTEGKKNTLVTMIPSLDYLIAEIIHTEKNGSTYKIQLKNVDYDADLLKQFYASLQPLANTNQVTEANSP